jgi:putative ABC transport system ATP-binding protein
MHLNTASSPSRLIRTTDLSRHYIRGPQEIRAVDGVNLEVQAAEFLAIVGSSGSGKSTLLNLLAGLDTPTSGSIEVDGAALSGLSRRELSAYRSRSVGMVFQTFNLIGHYTALQNVEIALYFGSLSRQERRLKSEAMLERLGLADRMDHRPADLSGGEQQRVAMARALVKEPRILLADEPTGNLDFDNARQIAELLAELNAAGLTVLLVTHDLALARQHAGRIVRMRYGEMTGERDLNPRGEGDT